MAAAVLRTDLLLLSLTLYVTAAGQPHGPAVATVVVEEGSAAILPCSLSTKENIEFKFFNWRKDGQKEVFYYDAGIHYNNGYPGQDEQFIGRVHHFPDQLKFGNASILIRHTKLSDSGNYTCDFTRLKPQRQTFYIQLVVGAAPRPHTRILSITEDRVLLQCEVQGASPEPQLQWKDSDGNILPAEEPQVSFRGGRYNVTLQTTVTKTTTNRFHCVVTQEDIGHVTDDEIHVPDELFKSCPGAGVWISVFLGGVIVTVVLVVPLLVVYIRMCIRRRIIRRPQKGFHEEMYDSYRVDREMKPMNPELRSIHKGHNGT